MSPFLSGLGVVLSLELRQRVRGVAWYVLLGIFIALVALVTGGIWLATVGFSTLNGDDVGDSASGGAIYSTIVYFVLLLGTLVAPALSGNAINGDREAGTLATTQVTLITTWQLIIGKFLAAWITALAFLAAALPFLIFGLALGGVRPLTVVSSALVLAVELGVVAAIGVGLSGIFAKPLFSIVVTYLIVATLSLGTLITFGIAGAATQTVVTSTYIAGTTFDEVTGEATSCGAPQVSSSPAPRFDFYWGILAANPYVVIADAAPTKYVDGNPQDLFGFVKAGARAAQVHPPANSVYSDCDPETQSGTNYKTPEQTERDTVPSWFVGLAIHVLLGAAALLGAWRRTNTPARTLTKGSRIA